VETTKLLLRHDPCKVRAAVFADGEKRVAIIGVDALVIRRPTVEAARKAIGEKCGIPQEAILISASHSHSAGPTGFVLPGEYDDAPQLVKTLAYEKSPCADPKYLAQVETAIADAVADANDHLAPVKAAAGFGNEGSAIFNRRFRMKDGQTWTHPGQGNPDIVEPAGPIDPQVGVLGAWDGDGKLIGCIVNYACHNTTTPGGTSADYVCYIEQTIRGLFGQQAIVVFLLGAAGDITQVDNRSPVDVKQFGEDNCRLVGGRVGAEAVKVLLGLKAGAGPLGPLGFESRMLQIPRRKPSAEHVARAMEIVQRPPPKTLDQTNWIFAKETVLLDAKLKREPIASVEVQAIGVGPAALLACPAEYFCQYGLDIKSRSKFPITLPVTLANDSVGYVPTEEAFGPNGGGYETRLTSHSNLDIKAGQMMADALIDLSSHMHPGAVPHPPPAPAFKGKPWAYGDVPPEAD